MNSRQAVVREAFDRHALVYDRQFSHRAIAQEIREDVWRLADSAFLNAGHLLDLGCGTGEDAMHYARQGKRVTAVDLSPQMIAKVVEKAAAAGFSQRLRTAVAEMDSYSPDTPFDGLISNFGALNCLPDLTWMREFAGKALLPASPVVLTTMGRFYPLETVVFLLKGQFGRAFRRFHRACDAAVEGVRFDVYYHSVRSMKQMLGPDFELEKIAGLRAFLPVPGFEHLQRFAIFSRLERLDRRFCASPRSAAFADHFVTLWRYRP